jgi:hypothetical protein
MPATNWRYLKPNKGSAGPEIVVCVDTETADVTPDDWDDDATQWHALRCGVAVAYRRKNGKWTGGTWLEFTNPNVWWTWLSQWGRKKSTVWVFAHNWHYDAQALNLWGEIDAGRFKIVLPPEVRPNGPGGKPVSYKGWRGLVAIDSCPFVVHCMGRAGSFRFVDSFNYCRVPLEKLAPPGAPGKLPQPDPAAADEEWFAYCRRDVEILAGFIKGLVDAWVSQDRGNFQPTAGRLAIGNYRHSHLWPKLLLHGDAEAQRLERDAYCGGEVRHWYNGEYDKPCHLVDMAGFYAAIMRDWNLPFRLVKHVVGPHAGRLLNAVGGERCIARVRIRTNNDHYPMKTDRVTCWPVGEFWTTLAGPELANAVDNGAVEDCSECAAYVMGPIFKTYAEYWLAERARAKEAGDYPAELLAKAMLVSLYGKFGALTAGWQTMDQVVPPFRWGTWAAPDPETHRLAKWRAIGGVAQIQREREERDDTFVAIPAFVCAVGRWLMRRVRSAMPARSALLQQTDSLLVTDAGLAWLREGGHLGAGEPGRMRLVQSFKSAEIVSANCWVADDCEKLAGVSGVRHRVGRLEWDVQAPSKSNEHVSREPDGLIRWTERRVRIVPNTGDLGHWTPGWSEGPLSAAELAERIREGDDARRRAYYLWC